MPAIFEHFQKWPKNLWDVLAHGLSYCLVNNRPFGNKSFAQFYDLKWRKNIL